MRTAVYTPRLNLTITVLFAVYCLSGFHPEGALIPAHPLQGYALSPVIVMISGVLIFLWCVGKYHTILSWLFLLSLLPYPLAALGLGVIPPLDAEIQSNVAFYRMILLLLIVALVLVLIGINDYSRLKNVSRSKLK